VRRPPSEATGLTGELSRLATAAPSALGKRVALRRQARAAQQLKMLTLALVALVVLGAIPLYLGVRAATQDPVFEGLNALNLPDWADGEHTDASDGSRWCVKRCRFRERTWQSARAPDETQVAYDRALREAGWRPRTTDCPTATEGAMTCWHRDEYLLDMWVRAPICETPPPRPTASATPGANPPSQAPACPGALVTVKVQNSSDYQRGI